LIAIFFLIIAVFQPSYSGLGDTSGSSAWLAMWVLPLILLSVAPAKAVFRRLLFLALGLLLVIALNELSKVGLDVTAPKLQGLSIAVRRYGRNFLQIC